MKFFYILVILLSDYALGNIVNNVRVVDYVGYITKVVTETVQEIEKKGWWNLKLPDETINIDEVVLRWHAKGTVQYKNGFVVSIQAVDVLQNSVAAQVNLNSAQQAQATVSGTLRMHDVAIGYDVQANLEEGTQHYTAIYVHPTVNFVFTITKITNTNDISATVVGSVTPSSNNPTFMPNDKATDVLTTLFVPTMSNPGIISWGPDVFTPLVTNIVSTQIEFPNLCYNCAA